MLFFDRAVQFLVFSSRFLGFLEFLDFWPTSGTWNFFKRPRHQNLVRIQENQEKQENTMKNQEKPDLAEAQVLSRHFKARDIGPKRLDSEV